MRLPFPIDTDFVYTFAATNPDGTPAAGLPQVSVHLSDSDGGDPINGTDIAATETATPGTYSATFAGSTMLTSLTAARISRDGYVVVTQAGKVLSSDPCSFVAAIHTQD